MGEKELTTRIETLEETLTEIKQVLIAIARRLDAIEKILNPHYSPTSIRAKAAEAFEQLGESYHKSK